MKTSARATAAAIYGLLALLAFGVLGILLTPPPPLSASLVATTPGLGALIGTLLTLGAISAALAVVLWRRVRVPTVTLRILMLSLPVLAVGWNFVVPLFWVVPVFFAWRSQGGT